MPLSRIKNIVDIFNKRFDEYVPGRMSYLDMHGLWQNNPVTVWEKASAELWYRLREHSSICDRSNCIKKLARTVASGDAVWKIIKKAVSPAIAAATPEANFLTFLNALCQLMEYSSYKINGGLHIAEWDYKGKGMSAEYALKIMKFYGRWGVFVKEDFKENILDRLVDKLRLESGLFDKISRLIAEEDKLTRTIGGLLAGMSDQKQRSEICELILEQVAVAVVLPAEHLQHMVRPCLGLLRNSDIPISSGIQYEAACVLGKVQDRRCAEAVIEQLKLVEGKHDNLSSALLYVLGRLGEPGSAGSFIEKLTAGSAGSGENNPMDFARPKSSTLEIREALWALGRQEKTPALAVPFLTVQSDNKDRDVKATLAWALGKIGGARLRETGGIETEIVATLLELLKDTQPRVSEEAVFSIKNLELPGLFSRLNLHNIAGKTALSLQPSRQGLYELSETLWYLIGKQQPVVMAVTGDSGTGKTFFCQCLVGGFGQWGPKDILYLARDNADHNDIFNRMLGLKFLKRHVLPQFYQNYPLSEEDDRPEEYFEQFIKQNIDKKLIILDGWRDDAYFHHVVSLFNQHEHLDVLLKFHASYSTRRLNLEEREGLLENVTTCLSYIEGAELRETRFHRDGKSLIYQLENSLPHRPGREEILELFQRRKIENWGRFIRVGSFGKVMGGVRSFQKKMERQEERFEIIPDNTTAGKRFEIESCEKHYFRQMSDNSKSSRHLLETIETGDVSVNCIALMGPGQVAFGGKGGKVGAFYGLGDQLNFHSIHDGEIKGIAVLDDEIWSIDDSGGLATTSFQQRFCIKWENNHPIITAIASDRNQLIATGHLDGSIRFWSQGGTGTKAVKLSGKKISAMTMGLDAKVFSLDQEGKVIVWDMEKDQAVSYNTGLKGGGSICRYPGGKIAVCQSGNGPRATIEVGIIDYRTGRMETFVTDKAGDVTSVGAYFDGRLLVGLKGRQGRKNAGTLMIIDPGKRVPGYWLLPGHKIESRNCLSLGPQILTCGSDTRSTDSLKIWGSADYVQQERKRSRLFDKSMKNPSHFQSIL